MELTTPLPFVVHVDDSDSPVDVIDAAVLGGFRRGHAPRSADDQALSSSARRTAPSADGVARSSTPNLPGSARPPRARRTAGSSCAQRWPNGGARITVVATHRAAGRSDPRSERAVMRSSPRPGTPPASRSGTAGSRCPSSVRTGHCPSSAGRTFARTTPPSTCPHSTASWRPTRRQLDGRLALLYGPPGNRQDDAHPWPRRRLAGVVQRRVRARRRSPARRTRSTS